MSESQRAIPLTTTIYILLQTYWHWCAPWQNYCFTAVQEVNFWAEKEQLKWKANHFLKSFIFTNLATLHHIKHSGCCYLFENYCNDLIPIWFFFLEFNLLEACTCVNWTEQQDHTDVQHSLERRRRTVWSHIQYVTKDANKKKSCHW